MKGDAVGDEECNNTKMLYPLLKVKDLSYLNYLYNAQGVILLLKIMENRFQAMYDKSMHNPRKCNSASKLSGCIQCEQSKVILVFPTNNLIMEIFEKASTDGFTCVNFRLSFDTENLMPNLKRGTHLRFNAIKMLKKMSLALLTQVEI